MTRIGKNASACQPKCYEYQPQIYEKEFRSLQLPVGWSSVCKGFIALRPYIAKGYIDSFLLNSGFSERSKNNQLFTTNCHCPLFNIRSTTPGSIYFETMRQMIYLGVRKLGT